MAASRIGVIIGSQRKPRCGDQISGFILDTIKSHQEKKLYINSQTSNQRHLTFQVIDVAVLNLPLCDEPGIPSQIKDSSGYAHEHTRAWSRTVAALDGFVFVTPQYNWGIPAGLKNALDYLYHEWNGKPAMIVSYGGHGGGKCAEALKVVLGGGLKMKVVDETVNLTFPSRDFLYKAAGGDDLGLNASDDHGIWAEERSEIIKVWEKMEQSF